VSYDDFLAKEQDEYYKDEDRVCCHECGWVGNIEQIEYIENLHAESDDMICSACGEEIK
jgi:hypothetical protein